MKRILVVSPTPTHPAIAGNRACILSYVELLKSLGNDVYFFWVVNPVYSDEDFKETQKYWGQHFFYYKKNIAHRILEFLFKRLRFGLTGYYKVDDMFPFGIERKARWLQRQFCFDVVIVNYVYLSKVFKFFRNSKKVLFTHDVFTNKYQKH